MPTLAASSSHDAVRSAVARARVLGEPSAVFAVSLEDHLPAVAEELLCGSVRGSDTVATLSDGVYCVVLFGMGRLPAASVAERLERRIADLPGEVGGSRVGMTLVEPWDLRDEHAVLRAACADLHDRHPEHVCEPVAA